MACQYPTDERGRARGGRPGPRPPWSAPLILLALLLAACASTGPAPPVAVDRPASRATFELGRDVFVFPNLVRSHHPERSVDFANYCIIMARAASQFFRFARFAPDRPAVGDAEYTRLARAVMDVGVWEAPWPPERRVVIPGYPDLYDFSRAREAAIKAAFDSSVLSMIHWRTWRAAMPLPGRHQARVARELREEVDAGRPAPIMITNYPDRDVLTHAVLVYGYRPSGDVVEFLAYDPNDPANPLSLYFDPGTRGFWVEPLPYSPPGRVRAFRLFTSPLL